MPAQEPPEQAGEDTPLIRDDVNPTMATPLPARQLCGLMPLLIAESVMSTSIMPYINQLVSDLPVTGGDKIKVGYYAGFIISLYFFGEAFTVLQWNRLSDSIGRKPVLLSGTLGLMIATILFGLSQTFWSLALSRFLAGALNGNIGVVKTMLGEMTDDTNIARVFSLIPLTWATGIIIGSSAGGFLSRPHDRWPQLFSDPFWVQHPYFLPCAATSVYAMASLVFASVFLKETLDRSPRDQPGEQNLVTFADENGIPEQDQEGPPRPSWSSSLLTKPVVLIVSIYAAHAYLEISNTALVAVVYTTPIRFGGLGLDPARMGTCLAAFGIITGFLPFLVFDRIVRVLGRRRALLAFMSCLIPAFLLFPINGTRAQHVGVDIVTWILVLLHLFMMVGINMTYGCIFIYVRFAAPQGMLGATNGIAQTVASMQRAVGPAIATALFSFSLEKNILGGYGVFYTLALCALAALWLASSLPSMRWTPENNVDDEAE